MSYQALWNGQNRIKRTVMFPGIAICCLKQHKMRILGVDAQYTFHFRVCLLQSSLNQHMSSLKENHLPFSYLLLLFPTQYTAHPFISLQYSCEQWYWSDILKLWFSKALKYMRTSFILLSLVWCLNYIYLSFFTWFKVFPMWEKQSSSVICYNFNGVTTTFSINCGLL